MGWHALDLDLGLFCSVLRTSKEGKKPTLPVCVEMPPRHLVVSVQAMSLDLSKAAPYKRKVGRLSPRYASFGEAVRWGVHTSLKADHEWVIATP